MGASKAATNQAKQWTKGLVDRSMRVIDPFGRYVSGADRVDDVADRTWRWRWSEFAVERQNRPVRRDARAASSLERGQPLTDFEKMRAAKGLGSEGVGAGGQWLSASTRHGASNRKGEAVRSAPLQRLT